MHGYKLLNIRAWQMVHETLQLTLVVFCSMSVCVRKNGERERKKVLIGFVVTCLYAVTSRLMTYMSYAE